MTAAEGTRFVVVLEETVGDEDGSGGRRLPIWVGEAEGTALAFALQAAELPRPFTHRFAAALLDAAGGTLRECRIARLTEGTFYAEAHLDTPAGPRVVDARPSDALNLAAVADAPVTVDASVLDAAALDAAAFDETVRGRPVGAVAGLPGVTADLDADAAAIVAERTARMETEMAALRTVLAERERQRGRDAGAGETETEGTEGAEA